MTYHSEFIISVEISSSSISHSLCAWRLDGYTGVRPIFGGLVEHEKTICLRTPENVGRTRYTDERQEGTLYARVIGYSCAAREYKWVANGQSI